MARTGRPKTGSIREHPPASRRWQVRWTENGKQRAKGGFPTKGAAREWLDERRVDLRQGRASSWDESKRTFAYFASAWLDGARERFKPKTLFSYQKVLAHHLIPTFGDRPVTDLDHPTWQRYFTDLSRKGAKPQTVRNVLTCARGTMKTALKARATMASPLDGLDLPKQEHRDKDALDASQLWQLVEALPEHWRLPVLLTGFLGLRSCETWALRILSVDLLRRELRINLAVSEIEGELVFHDPKSKASRRTLSLPGFLVEELRAHIERRTADGAQPEDPLFATEDGQPVRHGRFYDSHFRTTVRRLVKTGAFPHVNFHALRDTGASILINGGASLYDIKERLGHSTIAQTANCYGHLFESRDRELADALDQAHAQAKSSRPTVVPLRKADHDG